MSATLPCRETERFSVLVENLRQSKTKRMFINEPAAATEMAYPARTACRVDVCQQLRKVAHMVKTVYLRKEELDVLRMAAARSGRSVARLIRDAIRKIVLKPQAAGPVAIWDGEPKRKSIEHDSVHDER
jgi:hypothetical protein